MPRILVVEDEDDVRQTLREVIEDEGYAVDEAANGAEALDYLRTRPAPCLVLLDLMMPVVNGFQLLETVRADASLRTIPVVIVSAMSSERARAAEGAAAFLPKPVQLSALLDAVGKFC